MLCLARRRVQGSDLVALQPYLESGKISIVTKDDWMALKPEIEDEV